jgi:arginyl-tRNA synthetase
MKIEDKLKQYIAEVAEIDKNLINLDFPSDLKFGDFTSNIALIEGKKRGINPVDFAKKIADFIKEKQDVDIENVEAVSPGFVNIKLSQSFFANLLSEIISGLNYGSNNNLEGKNIFVEHTQPNPFKEFHIGHLMNNAIGESLARIIKESGAEVKTASYHGDVGLHVAKTIWAFSKGESDGDWGKAYVIGSKAYEESDEIKKEIIELNKKIYDKSDSLINELYEKGKTASFGFFKEMYKRLDSNFDFTFLESETGEVGRKIVLDNIGKVFEESDGAVVYKGEKVGLHTRVFLNSEKLPTYEAKEVGLAKTKKEKFNFDQSITITGNEQNDFFSVCEAAIGEVFPELKDKLKHIGHGMLRLPEGKMSSRTGNIISAQSLIEDVKSKVVEKMEGRDFENKNEVAEAIAVGAIKFSILKQAIGKDIIFDFDKSLSFEGDSGPYLQYSAVRAQRVIDEANAIGLSVNFDRKEGEVDNVERLLLQMPLVVSRASKEYAPQYIVTYLLNLASAFNSFYANKRVIDGGESARYRLSVVSAFKKVIEEGLSLLAIKIPERM